MDKNQLTKIGIAFLFVVLICAGIVLGAWTAKNRQNTTGNEIAINPSDKVSGEVIDETNSGETSSEESGEEEEVYLGPNIFSGDARPIAVMIDNERPAWENHGGLNSAYMLYEFIIEGGETRIMAFFKNVNPTYIGPVRSARHYFLDYAMEHDAVFVHFGWSPLAQSNISSLNINNINGIYDNFYWRVPPKNSYHNAVTSMENIKKQIGYKKYRDISSNGPIIAYNRYDTDITSGDVANKIQIKYSGLQNVSYAYDAERKVYLRSMRGEAHKDSQTGEQFYAKNIIMIKVRDELLDDPEDKERRNLYNIGTGEGYFATNGKIEKITWKKSTRNSKTQYFDMNGKELTINDGITWTQIVPVTGSITFET